MRIGNGALILVASMAAPVLFGCQGESPVVGESVDTQGAGLGASCVPQLEQLQQTGAPGLNGVVLRTAIPAVRAGSAW
jgi:hypothetical protein